jgi:hypothetical protein
MELEIRPFESVGPVGFGMSQAEVRRVLEGLRVDEYWKTPDSVGPTDHFVEGNLHVFYDAKRLVRGIEVFRPTDATLNGRPLLGRPFDEVTALLRQADPSVSIEDSSIESPQLGISLFVPDADDDPNAPVVSVYVSPRQP